MSVISRNSAVMLTPADIKRREMPTVENVSTPRSAFHETPRQNYTLSRIQSDKQFTPLNIIVDKQFNDLSNSARQDGEG